MDQFVTAKELREYCRESLRPLGLVPTMGSLHEGHMSLIEYAGRECKTTVASIFVNPAQFGPSEDFNAYPRSLEPDIGMLQRAGVDAVFLPTIDEMYPSDFMTSVEIGGPSVPLEGQLRPGHFAGVATIVSKLLLAALPDVAYFGQKDAQQLAVVRRMVLDLGIPSEIRVVPTVRTPDGVAVSSRHAYLSKAQIAAGSAIFEGLSAAKSLFNQGERETATLLSECSSVIGLEPMITHIDYLALVDPHTMEPWDGDGLALMVISVRIAGVRLIDNLFMNAGDDSPEAR